MIVADVNEVKEARIGHRPRRREDTPFSRVAGGFTPLTLPKIVSEEPEPGYCDALYAEFQPLVWRLIRQYGDDADLREDLIGEIYARFRTVLAAYDPHRGVPLRPYLVRQLS